MTYLSEDPTFLAGGLLLLAVAFGIALNVTQQGKYLIRAVVAALLAVVVIGIEWVWVTDNERIENVVYDLRRAVSNSDVEGVLGHMAPNVQFLRGELVLDGESTRSLIRGRLANAHFDFVRISNLQTNAGRQTRRGTAVFQVLAKGTLDTSQVFGTANSVWELGFQETAPGVWKVSRITPVQVPNEALAMVGGASNRAHLGYNDQANQPQQPGRRAMMRRRYDPRQEVRQ
jgi:hypothetical protein